MPGWFDVSAPVGVGLTNSEDECAGWTARCGR
jgi:hypothetical protein